MPPPIAAPAVNLYKQLPSVNELLRSTTGLNLGRECGARHLTMLARQVIAGLRNEIAEGSVDGTKASLLAKAEQQLIGAWQADKLVPVRRVINATGVIIHTNLGRAALSEAAIEAIRSSAGFCTLEYDLAAGTRGKRGRYAEKLICELTGAEDALIVNNCAAAAFFVLTALAAGGEVIISRGELVEIGGDFRIPDVLAQSGAKMVEVGTTNRTKLTDYEAAVNGDTQVILRVHPSNYRIVGFTTAPPLADLAALAHDKGLFIYEDLGSGALVDLSQYGLKEPTVRDSITAGVHIVTFSGDKLLGGPQAGIIAGSGKVIDRLRKHPLYRALRADKLVLSGLEATLEAFRRGTAFNEIPVLRMLSQSYGELRTRAEAFIAQVNSGLGNDAPLSAEIAEGSSAVGGGSAPGVELQSPVIALTHKNVSSTTLEYHLRRSATPVIARIADDKVLIDMRTVTESDEAELTQAILALSDYA